MCSRFKAVMVLVRCLGRVVVRVWCSVVVHDCKNVHSSFIIVS
jgi:hypothetical protein